MKAWLELIAVIKKLRDKDRGCPWDISQDHQSLRPYIIEEAYEVVAAIDKFNASPTNSPDHEKMIKNLKEELGDLLFQPLLHAQIASERGDFDIEDIVQILQAKLIRRHPHVFGDKKFSSLEEISQNWEEQKRSEGKIGPTVLSAIPPSLPALLQAEKTIKAVSKVGFQWPDLKGPIDKMQEEWQEFLEEVEKNPDAQKNPNLEKELGDLLFCVANIAFKLKINPEIALKGMLERFENRFNFVENEVLASGKNWADFSLAELDEFWSQAKKN